MPYARLPPDRLIVLPLFNINLIKEEGEFLWYEVPERGRMRVLKSSPRIWFESMADAHQAGACGVLLTAEEQERADAETLTAADGGDEPASPDNSSEDTDQSPGG